MLVLASALFASGPLVYYCIQQAGWHKRLRKFSYLPLLPVGALEHELWRSELRSSAGLEARSLVLVCNLERGIFVIFIFED